MRKATLILSLAALLAVNTSAKAESNHTFSAGYASNDFLNSKGFNTKYIYDNSDLPVGWAGSFTSTWNEQDMGFSKMKFNYYSLTTGPALRVADFVTLYALAGASKGQLSYSHSDAKSDTYGFTWGLGVQVDLIQNLVLDAGYERSSLAPRKSYDRDDKRTQMNVWTVGVGYRF